MNLVAEISHGQSNEYSGRKGYKSDRQEEVP